jgi:hypothetical protein
VRVAVGCCRGKLIGVRGTWECELARVWFQLDETLMPAVPGNQLGVKELLGIKRTPVLEDAVEGASELLRDNRQGFGFAVLADQPLVKLLGRGVGSEE